MVRPSGLSDQLLRSPSPKPFVLIRRTVRPVRRFTISRVDVVFESRSTVWPRTYPVDPSGLTARAGAHDPATPASGQRANSFPVPGSTAYRARLPAAYRIEPLGASATV